MPSVLGDGEGRAGGVGLELRGVLALGFGGGEGEVAFGGDVECFGDGGLAFCQPIEEPVGDGGARFAVGREVAEPQGGGQLVDQFQCGAARLTHDDVVHVLRGVEG